MKRPGVQFIRFVLLVFGSLVFVMPLVWMFITAIKPVDQTMSMPPQWVPLMWHADVDGSRQKVHVDKNAYEQAKAQEQGEVEALFAYRWVTTIGGQEVPVRVAAEVPGPASGTVDTVYHGHWKSSVHDGYPVRLLSPIDQAEGLLHVYVMQPDGIQYTDKVDREDLELVYNDRAEQVEQSFSVAFPVTLPIDALKKQVIAWDDRDKLAFTHTESRSVPLASLSKSVVPRWGNFAEAIAEMKHFPRYLYNTLVLCVLTVLGTTFSSAVVAYGFSRVQWKGRDKVFLLVLATMMIPFPVTMVPLYGLFRDLGWIGTLKPLWVPAFFASAFNVFLLRQFFRTIPMELSEAARIDGCSEFRIFWQIVLPLAKPAITVVALFQFLATWNDFLGPLIYLTDQKDFTLALGLQFFQSQHGGTPWHLLMAASTLIVIPVIALFFLAQRTFIEGVSMSGLKG
ncbi:MAG: carbohydrate ABC transporter permease [Planctomycetota bacterium]